MPGPYDDAVRVVSGGPVPPPDLVVITLNRVQAERLAVILGAGEDGERAVLDNVGAARAMTGRLYYKLRAALEGRA